MSKIISLIGRSGCGKGTQAKMLMEHFGNMFYISTGDLFRNLAKQPTLVGKKIKQAIEGGQFPFDDIAVALLLHQIAYNVKENQGLLLDGAVRRIEEARVFDNFLKWLGLESEAHYILIDISREEAFNRLTKRRICVACGRLVPWVGDFKKLTKCDKCGGKLTTRADDTMKAINTRLDYFDNEVMKTIKHYQKQKTLIVVNGEQSIENVFQDILKVLPKK